MSSFRTLSAATLLAFVLVSGKAASQDHPSAHTVVPLHEFSEGQWVEKVSGDATKTGEPFVNPHPSGRRLYRLPAHPSDRRKSDHREGNLGTRHGTPLR